MVKDNRSERFFKKMNRARLIRFFKMILPISIFECSLLGIALTTYCVVTDWFCVKSNWNSVLLQNPTYLRIISLACAIALDVPLAVAGYHYKKYKQGLEAKEDAHKALIISIVIFSIAFILTFVFRWEIRDLSFSVQNQSLLSNSLSQNNSSNKDYSSINNIASIYNGMIPLLTSLTSFLACYFTSNPLQKSQNKLKRNIISVSNNKEEVQQAIKESEAARDHAKRVLARTVDLLRCKFQEIDVNTAEEKVDIVLQILRINPSKEMVKQATECIEDIFKNYKTGDILGDTDYTSNNKDTSPDDKDDAPDDKDDAQNNEQNTQAVLASMKYEEVSRLYQELNSYLDETEDDDEENSDNDQNQDDIIPINDSII